MSYFTEGEKRWIKRHTEKSLKQLYNKGVNMKPTKTRPAKITDTTEGKILMKLKKLSTAIEQKKGPSMDIDDLDYRWVEDRIEYLEKNNRMLSKQEMSQANNLWNSYK